MDTKKQSRQRAYQTRNLLAGNCTLCGAVRGPDGTAHHCRTCADKKNARKRLGYLTSKGELAKNEKG